MATINIIVFQDNRYSRGLGNWRGEYNPKDLDLNYANHFVCREANGISQSPTYQGPRPTHLEIPLIFDNTLPIESGDSSRASQSVRSRVEEFLELIYVMNGDSHQGNFLKLISGDFIFKGQCMSVKVRYTAFNRQGVPNRAFVQLRVVQSLDLELKRQKANQNSPDMSHFVQIIGKESLASVASEYYHDPMYCLELAKVNRIPSPRSIPTGTRILVPPLIN